MAFLQKAMLPFLPQIIKHPFNQGLYTGMLPAPVFRSYLDQDALYLRDFAMALMLISTRFTSSWEANFFKFLSEEIIDTEYHLHKKYLREFKNPHVKKSPVVSAYAQHLLYHAKNAPLEEAVASIAPCFWIYAELGKHMACHPNNPYYAWLHSYVNHQFISAGQGVFKVAETLNNKNACPIKKNNQVLAFTGSIKYELLFWDSVFTSRCPTPHPPLSQRTGLKNICTNWSCMRAPFTVRCKL